MLAEKAKTQWETFKEFRVHIQQTAQRFAAMKDTINTLIQRQNKDRAQINEYVGKIDARFCEAINALIEENSRVKKENAILRQGVSTLMKEVEDLKYSVRQISMRQSLTDHRVDQI